MQKVTVVINGNDTELEVYWAENKPTEHEHKWELNRDDWDLMCYDEGSLCGSIDLMDLEFEVKL